MVSFRCICGIAYFLLFNDNIMVRPLRFYSLFSETTTPHGVQLCGESSSRGVFEYLIRLCRHRCSMWDFAVYVRDCVCVELVEFDCWVFASHPFLLFSGPGLVGTLSFTFHFTEWKIPRQSRDSSYSTPTTLEEAVTGSEWRSRKWHRS